MNVRRGRGERGPAVPRRLPTSPFKSPDAPAPAEIFAVGDRVNHDRYGLGTVVEIEGERSVVVDFGPETRRIALPNPKLSRI
jgi:hypothetical protein